jgi:hypothetical protein
MGLADGRRPVRTAVVLVLVALGVGSGHAAAQCEHVPSTIELAAGGYLVIEGEVLKVGAGPYVEFKVASVVGGELSKKTVRVWDLPVSERAHFALGTMSVGSRWLVALTDDRDAAPPGDLALPGCAGDPIQVATKAGQPGVSLAELTRQINGKRAERPMVELERSAPWHRWEVKIYRSGRAVCHYHKHGEPEEPKCTVDRQLEATAVSKIEAAIRKARFFDLPEDIEPITYSLGDDGITVTVRLGTRVKTVSLTGTLDINTDEIARLRTVWTTVDRLVPEPR